MSSITVTFASNPHDYEMAHPLRKLVEPVSCGAVCDYTHHKLLLRNSGASHMLKTILAPRLDKNHLDANVPLKLVVTYGC